MRGRSYTIKSLAFGALVAMVTLIGSAVRVNAQGTATAPPTGVRLGPVALAPVIRLSDFGYDSNVYNRSEDNNPAGDFSSRLSPVVDATMLSSRAHVIGHSGLDFYYFKTLPDLSAVDADNSGQVEFLVNRLTLLVSGRHQTTRQRRNLEIDSLARRRTTDTRFGAAWRLSGKTSIEVSAERSHLQYDADSLFLETNLAQVLNRSSWTQTVAVQYAATALTKFTVEASRARTRFDSEVDRDSSEWRVAPSVKFSPFALVSGQASVGFYKRTFPTISAQPAGTTGSQPGGTSGLPTGSTTAQPSSLGDSQTTGTTALVDLNYTLLGRTRLTVQATRRLDYSYLIVLNDYVEATVTGLVTQRLGDSWDVMGRFGRGRLTYHQKATADSVPQIPGETVWSSGVDVGYNVGRTRVGLYLQSDKRATDLAAEGRGYLRVRFGASATYSF